MNKKILKALIAEATKRGLKTVLKENTKPKVFQITRTELAEGVKKALTLTLQENAKPKVFQITRSQLAEGIKKALFLSLKESGIPGDAMPAQGSGAVPEGKHGEDLPLDPEEEAEIDQAALDHPEAFAPVDGNKVHTMDDLVTAIEHMLKKSEATASGNLAKELNKLLQAAKN